MNIVLTGASAGFGEAIATDLVGRGYTVVGLARRADKLHALHAKLGDQFVPVAVDLTDRVALADALQSIEQLDVLINNAGLALGLTPAQNADISDWQTMIDTNINAVLSMTHWALPKMVAQNSGLIVNLGSVAGTYPYFGGNIYGATKAFLRQFSLNLRADLAGTGVRVSCIEPGLCGGTEFSLVRFNGDSDKVSALYDGVEYLTAQDIARTVAFIIESPKHMNINSIEIMPTAQSFAPLAVHKNAK